MKSGPPPKKSQKVVHAQKNNDARIFPIVGIGASAGGLEAFKQLLNELPSNTGMAFVLIQHLDPSHESSLPEALGNSTGMPANEIINDTQVLPNHIYVIPPNMGVEIHQGTLTLLPRDKTPHTLHMPIDHFFRTLAYDLGNQSIGVVLSGNASDGTEGLRAIKAENGITLVQDPKTAKFSGMPESAVAAAVVDICLPIPELAHELIRLARHPCVYKRAPELPLEHKDIEHLFLLLRTGVGVDFSEYKMATIKRRLIRRMALHKKNSLHDYVEFLENNTAEVTALYEDLLITVTSFFRDPDVFKALSGRVFPELMKNKPPGAPIRIWVPGCASGEEAYSLAILLLEFLQEHQLQSPVQIFGSDLSERFVERARTGFFRDSAVLDLDPVRLRRFFTRVAGGYQISESVRDLCVFIRHDLARDPPFSKLDLVSCRNVLIYLDSALQKKIISTFHHCLNQPGFLLLGRSESVPGYEQMFSTLDPTNKIFSRSVFINQLKFQKLKDAPLFERKSLSQTSPGISRSTWDVTQYVDHLLLNRYAPSGVIVNEQLEILQFRGRTGDFLEPPTGRPELNILKMVRQGLLADLTQALRLAREKKSLVRKDGVQVQLHDSSKTCNLVVIPVTSTPKSKELLFLVLFEDTGLIQLTRKTADILIAQSPRKSTDRKRDLDHDPYSAHLELELKATQEYLHTLDEEHQRLNDALTATNEELESGNEELQSMNEELETAKEELQSTNEELTTVNDELQNRNLLLNQINDDLTNLLDSVHIPIIMLDLDRKIRRFNPSARNIMSLLPGDIGRMIHDIKFDFSMDRLDQQIRSVLQSATFQEFEEQSMTGCWYRIQIRPYKTNDQRIDGVVISFIDIDVLKRNLSDSEHMRDYAISLVEAIQVPLLVLDEQIRVISANQAFYVTFGLLKTDTAGKSLHELGIGQWQIKKQRISLDEMLIKTNRFRDVEVECEFPNLGKRTLALSAQQIHTPVDSSIMILLAIEDISNRKYVEQERKELLQSTQDAKAEADQANLTKDLFLATLSHELRTPLTSLLLQTQLLRRSGLDHEKITRISSAIELAAKMQAQLVDDLLDTARITSGKLKINFIPTDMIPIIQTALDMVTPLALDNSILIEAHLDPTARSVTGDPIRLRQVCWNLLTNAIKFSPKGGKVVITLQSENGYSQIQVKDEGTGIAPDYIPHIFKPFTQAGSSTTRVHGGLGLGLSIVHHIIERHGGEVSVESAGINQGATFTVKLPLLNTQTLISETSESPSDGLSGYLNHTDGLHTLQGLRIMIVEDDRGTRTALAELLEQNGAEVRTASSAEEAMQVLESFQPEEMICDIAMPGEDGYSLIRRIRKLDPRKGGNIPALALTALVSRKDQLQALSAGFQMHLSKPVDYTSLEKAILDLSKQGRTLH